jgi:hypothetical protein
VTQKIRKKVCLIHQKEDLTEDMILVQNLLQRHCSEVTSIVSSDHDMIVKRFKTQALHSDILIIDHYYNHGIELIERLLRVKPKQNTIVLSGSILCSELQGCEYCTANHNKIRLLKPILKQKLFDAINDFEKMQCEYKQRCEKVASQLQKRVY